MECRYKHIKIRTILLFFFINVMPLTLFSMRCLYQISSMEETGPWPGENPYSMPQTHRNMYIEFNKMPFIYSPWALDQVRLTAEQVKQERTKEKERKKIFLIWGVGGGGEWERQRAPGRVGTSHVTWPKPVSGAALTEAGDDRPRHGYRLRSPSLPGADY